MLKVVQYIVRDGNVPIPKGYHQLPRLYDCANHTPSNQVRLIVGRPTGGSPGCETQRFSQELYTVEQYGGIIRNPNHPVVLEHVLIFVLVFVTNVHTTNRYQVHLHYIAY